MLATDELTVGCLCAISSSLCFSCVRFDTEEQAIAFAKKEGFHYTVLPYHQKKLKAKAFADNFKSVPSSEAAQSNAAEHSATQRHEQSPPSLTLVLCSLALLSLCLFHCFRWRGPPKASQEQPSN